MEKTFKNFKCVPTRSNDFRNYKHKKTSKPLNKNLSLHSLLCSANQNNKTCHKNFNENKNYFNFKFFDKKNNQKNLIKTIYFKEILENDNKNCNQNKINSLNSSLNTIEENNNTCFKLNKTNSSDFLLNLDNPQKFSENFNLALNYIKSLRDYIRVRILLLDFDQSNYHYKRYKCQKLISKFESQKQKIRQIEKKLCEKEYLNRIFCLQTETIKLQKELSQKITNLKTKSLSNKNNNEQNKNLSEFNKNEFHKFEIPTLDLSVIHEKTLEKSTENSFNVSIEKIKKKTSPIQKKKITKILSKDVVKIDSAKTSDGIPSICELIEEFDFQNKKDTNFIYNKSNQKNSITDEFIQDKNNLEKNAQNNNDLSVISNDNKEELKSTISEQSNLFSEIKSENCDKGSLDSFSLSSCDQKLNNLCQTNNSKIQNKNYVFSKQNNKLNIESNDEIPVLTDESNKNNLSYKSSFNSKSSTTTSTYVGLNETSLTKNLRENALNNENNNLTNIQQNTIKQIGFNKKDKKSSISETSISEEIVKDE